MRKTNLKPHKSN